MNWAFEALAALKRIVLLEERISNLTEQSKGLMDTCKDLDRRLLRLEAKFELIERMGSARERPLLTPPVKKRKQLKKID